jgi:hypothetical protein
VLLQESPPLVVQERSVRLQMVFPQQRGLASLPGKHHLAAILPFDVLADVGFQDFIGDAEFVAADEQVFFVEIVAVRAVQVADGPDGFTIAWYPRSEPAGAGHADSGKVGLSVSIAILWLLSAWYLPRARYVIKHVTSDNSVRGRLGRVLGIGEVHRSAKPLRLAKKSAYLSPSRALARLTP